MLPSLLAALLLLLTLQLTLQSSQERWVVVCPCRRTATLLTYKLSRRWGRWRYNILTANLWPSREGERRHDRLLLLSTLILWWRRWRREGMVSEW